MDAKVGYVTLSGSVSTAYVEGAGPMPLRGTDKYTDEPVTVRWDGTQWLEVADRKDGAEPLP